MIVASNTMIAKVTGKVAYPTGKFHDAKAARVNEAVVAASGHLPCYAIPGKRVAFKWVSIGSSAVISRKEAANFLARVGVNIEQAEAA